MEKQERCRLTLQEKQKAMEKTGGCKYFVAKKIILWYNFLKIIAKEVQYER